MDQILYCVFAAVALLAALLAVTRKNAVAAACWLVIMFFGLAAIFVLLEAYFVAAVQILVYAGAIMVLFLFVIMLLDLRSAELKARAGPSLKLVGILLAGVFFGAVVYAVSEAAAANSKTADRVSAFLRLPAPPAPPVSEDPLAPPPAMPAAPAPIAIELSEDAAAANAAGRTYRGRLPKFAGGPAIAAPVAIVLRSSGDPELTPGGPEIPTAWKAGPTAGSRTATVRISYDPADAAIKFAEIEWTVERGGLEASVSGGPDGSPRAIGRSIFETWLLPFEITSLLLTGAIFGAVVLTKRKLS